MFDMEICFKIFKLTCFEQLILFLKKKNVNKKHYIVYGIYICIKKCSLNFRTLWKCCHRSFLCAVYLLHLVFIESASVMPVSWISRCFFLLPDKHLIVNAYMFNGLGQNLNIYVCVIYMLSNGISIPTRLCTSATQRSASSSENNSLARSLTDHPL